MGEIHGRITYSAEDIQRIKAASFHDVPVKAETPAIKETVRTDDDGTVTDFELGAWTSVLLLRADYPHLVVLESSLRNSVEIPLEDLDTVIALLERVKAKKEGK